MEEQVTARPHKLNFLNRGIGTVTGVRDVKAFNEQEILLETDMGMLSIKGSELHVTKLSLDKGEVEIDGLVDSFSYSAMKASAQGSGFLGKLFK